MWKKLFGRLPVATKTIDPLTAAVERPEIMAAARYWRQRVANARIGGALDPSQETTVRSPFSGAELDLFETAMAKQFAATLVHVPDASLFQERGLDVSFSVTSAAWDLGLRSKLAYPGFFTRMRILLDKEAACELPPYQSGNWQPIWSAPASADGQVQV